MNLVSFPPFLNGGQGGFFFSGWVPKVVEISLGSALFYRLPLLAVLLLGSLGGCRSVESVRASKEPEPRFLLGLEVLAQDLESQAVPPGLGGKKIGLVVHGASLTADGRHAIDVLRDGGLEVVRLFSPEHGLRGQAAAGEAVANGQDPSSGLPVVSLYGKNRKPRPEDLQDLDVLIFDLQGAGVRFYTYVSTLILCLEAAAEAGVEMVVLDRPNPLGGLRVEGPVAAPRDVVPASFVNLAPGPLVHGLTLGEMARLANDRLPAPAKLRVIPMKGWQRRMTWADTGLTWIPPSPNLRTPQAALAYPGVALLESTNVSEGRGTEAPFLRLGAPWLDPSRLELSTPGFELVETRFVPTGSPTAPNPKYLDEPCRGFEVRVTDPAVADPYRLGISLLAALTRHPEFRWRRDGEALTWLLGTPNVFAALEAQATVEEILETDLADHAAWRLRRREFLLY